MKEDAMNKTAFALASALVLGTFGLAQAGEGNGHPFDMSGRAVIMAGSSGQDTGSEASPAFTPGQQPVQANAAGRDTGSDAYQDYAGQAAGTNSAVGVASR
jgi:hypothetical protein